MTETAHPTVYEAWAEVMRDVRAIAVDQTGSGISYKFRGVNQVLDAFGPILRERGVVVFPAEASAQCRDFANSKGNIQHEAIVTVAYTVVGPAGDSFTGQVVGGSADSSDKAVPQAMSVALRTFFLQAACVPTQDPEPDLNVVERANAADEAARADGWADAAERAASWDELAAAMKSGGDDSVKQWGKSEGITKDTLTKDQADEWRRRLTPDVAGNLLDTLAPEEPNEAEDFDRATVWATLHEWHGLLASQERFDKIARWIEENNISDLTLTREQAETWKAGMVDQPLKGTDPKAQGWKSKAERERTFASLTERTAGLPEIGGMRTVIVNFTADYTKDSLTKEQATEWLAMIEEALQEPF